MTEAMKNHFTPDVRVIDFESFKKTYLKHNKLEENDKQSSYDRAEKFIGEYNHKNLDYNYAFFVDKKGNKYAAHFFFYSLLNVPVSWYCSVLEVNPLLPFMITNMLFVLISCFVFFRYSKFSQLETAAFTLLFFFSTNYWYLCWQHPEVFSFCFVAMGLWIFLYGRNYIGIILVSLAALQNQPIAIIVAALCVITLFQKGINLKTISKLIYSSFIVLIPSVFYYVHYGVTNLISYQGALKFSYVTANRVIGFFFDLNQGVILALPFVLLLYIFLIIRKTILLKHQSVKLDLILLPALILSVCIAATIDNWNHGQAVVNRYVTYASAVILVHCFYLLFEFKNKMWRNTFIVIALATQIVTVFYHQKLSKFDWSTNIPKPISNYVLTNYPALYNPDPIIFVSRYNPPAFEDASFSPAYFMKPDEGTITKLLVHEDYRQNLIKFGLSSKQIDSIYDQLKFNNKWAYVPITEALNKIIANSKFKEADKEEKINREIEVIKANTKWFEIIKKKATDSGIPLEETLRKDAAFVLGIELSTHTTIEDKLKIKIEQIKADPAWLLLIEEKAKKLNISIDSALLMDAKWSLQTETKK